MNGIEAYPLPGFREPVSCFSHLLAVPVFAVLSYFLLRRGRGDLGRTASLAILAAASIFLLSMSATYHMLDSQAARYVLMQLDVAGIFALIAGTATPVHAILFRGINRWLPLVFGWSVALVGISLRAFFAESLAPQVLTSIYLLMGWGGLFSFFLLWRRYGFWFVSPLLFGGIAYTLGAIVLMLNWPILIPGVVGAHELWHFAVLAGLGLHWAFIFQFAAGPPPARTSIRNSAGADADAHTQRQTLDDVNGCTTPDYSDACQS
jgi:channel protein (hemolysin III family)